MKINSKEFMSYLVSEYLVGLKYDLKENVVVNDKVLYNFMLGTSLYGEAPYHYNQKVTPGGMILVVDNKERMVVFNNSTENEYVIGGNKYPTPSFYQNKLMEAIKRDCEDDSIFRVNMTLHYLNKSYEVVGNEPEPLILTGSYYECMKKVKSLIDNYLAHIIVKTTNKFELVHSIQINPATFYYSFYSKSMESYIDYEKCDLDPRDPDKWKNEGIVGRMFGMKIILNKRVPNGAFIVKTTEEEELDPEKMYKLGFQFEIDRIKESMDN